MPTKQDPKVLGVTLDPMLTFKQHVKAMKDKINNHTNILKALAGSTWGKDKEDLTTTNSAIGKSVLNSGVYKAPYSPQSSCWGRKSSGEEGKGRGRK